MEILALVLLGILAVWLSVWTVIIVLQSRDIADMAKQITKITLTVRTLQRLNLNEYYNNQDDDK